MNIIKLNTIVIGAVTLLGMEAALAASKKPMPDSVVPSTATKVKASHAAPARHMAAPLVKRSVLLSAGKANPSTSDISSNLAAGGYADPQVTDTSNATTFAIGFRQPIGNHWSVDMTYIDQGEVTASVSAAPSGANPAQDVALSLPIYGSGVNYAGLRHFRVGRSLTAHVGAGAFIYTSERQATIDGVSYVEKDGGIKPMGQLGLSYAITPRVSLELTGQRFFMSGDDVDRLSLGVSVGF